MDRDFIAKQLARAMDHLADSHNLCLRSRKSISTAAIGMSLAAENLFNISDEIGVREEMVVAMGKPARRYFMGEKDMVKNTRSKYDWHKLKNEGDSFFVECDKTQAMIAQKSIIAAAFQKFGPGAIRTKRVYNGLWVFLKRDVG